MKLLLEFGAEENGRIVEWDKHLHDFPNVVTYMGKYWQWVMYDKDESGKADQRLIFGNMRESALAVDMFGKVFPVPDIDQMFGTKVPDGPCECGAKFTSFPDHHMIKCPRWSRR